MPWRSACFSWRPRSVSSGAAHSHPPPESPDTCSLERDQLRTERIDDMKNLSRWIGGCLTALVIGALACSSTTFVSTWSAPDAKPVRLAGKKVVAVFLTKTGSVRRRAEDVMGRELNAGGAQAGPSYPILSDEEAKDPENAKAKLSSLGFEGAVVMRVVGKESDVNYVPGGAVWIGPRYHHFWGYWGWGWEPSGNRAI